MMALPELKQGHCVRFRLGMGPAYGQVLRPPKGDAPGLIVDAGGKLHDLQPSECDAVPHGMAGRLKFVCARVMRTAQFQNRLAAHESTTYTKRAPERRVQPRGTYGTPQRPVGLNSHRIKHDAEGYPTEPPNTFKGQLDILDPPLVMAEGFTGNPTVPLVNHISWIKFDQKKLDLEEALRALEKRRPLQADAFIRIHLGGRPWWDEHARLLTGPMSIAEIARLRETSPSNIRQLLIKATHWLDSYLGYDCRKYAPFARRTRVQYKRSAPALRKQPGA